MKKLILPLLLVMISGCGYEIKKGASSPTQGGGTPVNPEAPQPPVGTTVSFASIQKSILVPTCLKCHNGPTGSGGVDLSTHAGVLEWVAPGDAPNSTLYTEVESGSMPKRAPRLTEEQCNTIRDWINAGAKSN